MKKHFTLKETKRIVDCSVSSVFTKDDVMKLLNHIKEDEPVTDFDLITEFLETVEFVDYLKSVSFTVSDDKVTYDFIDLRVEDLTKDMKKSVKENRDFINGIDVNQSEGDSEVMNKCGCGGNCECKKSKK